MGKRKNLTLATTFILAIIIIGYAIFNSRLLIAGPQIIVKGPETGSVFEDPLIELRGIAKNTAFITLDGNPVYVDEDGNFNEKLLLSPGTSIISLDATDRFDRATEITLWYTYKSGEEIVVPTITDIATSSVEEDLDSEFNATSLPTGQAGSEEELESE